MFSGNYASSRYAASMLWLVFICAESDDSGLGLLTQAVILLSLCIPAGLCLGYFRLVNFRAFSQRCSPLSLLMVTELLMMEGTKGEESS